jgi:hypothetical protein
MVPMTDSEWTTLLEGVGLTPPTPLRAPSALGTWHYCGECQLTVRADRVTWWPASQRTCQFTSAMVTEHAGRPLAGGRNGVRFAQKYRVPDNGGWAMTREQQGAGGRKEPWDSATRREVMRRARTVGPEKAGAAFGVPSGTVRSWLRRAAVKAADDDDVEARLAAVRAEGAAIVERRELQMASPEWPRLQEAEERVRLATIRWIEASEGSRGRVEAEVELTEAKLQAAELKEELERREW